MSPTTLVVAIWAAATVFVIWMAVATAILRHREQAWQRRLYEQAQQGSRMVSDRELMESEYLPPPN